MALLVLATVAFTSPHTAAAVGDACLPCHAVPGLAMAVGAESVPLYVDSAAYDATAHATVECTACHTNLADPHDTSGASADLRVYGSWARFSQKNTDVTVSRNFYTVPASACLACHTDDRFAAFALSEHATIKDLKFNADGSPRQEVIINGVHTNENFVAADCERCHIGNNCGTCHFRTSVLQKGGVPYPGLSVLDLWTDYSAGADSTKGTRTEWSLDRTSNTASHDFRGAADLTSSNEVCTACHIGYYQGDKSNSLIDTHGIGVRRHPQVQELALTHERGVHTGLQFCTDCHTELHDLYLTNTEAGGRLGGNTQCTDCHSGYPEQHTGGDVGHADVTCIACHDAELSEFAGGQGVMRDPGNDNKVVVKAIKHDVEENWPSHNVARTVKCAKCHVAGNEIGAAVLASVDGGYVGAVVCGVCHAAIKADWDKTGHANIYRYVGGQEPVSGIDTVLTRPDKSWLYPEDGLISGSGPLDWANIGYAVGGFWKVRWGVFDDVDNSSTGYVWSSTLSGSAGAQFNPWAADPTFDIAGVLADWDSYGNATGRKKYECAICHHTNGRMTNPERSCYAAPVGLTEPWTTTGLTPVDHGGFFGEWSLDTVQCEACHGPGEDHVNNHSAQGTLSVGTAEICAKCHSTSVNLGDTYKYCGGDADPRILVAGARLRSTDVTKPYIEHEGQYNEMVGCDSNGDGVIDASDSGAGVHRSLTCTSCHDPHKRAHKVTDDVAGALEIADNDQSAQARGAVASCETCHPGKKLAQPMAGVTCVDCHMAEATRSAVWDKSSTWGRWADDKTHIVKIDPSKTVANWVSAVNAFGKAVAPGYITVEYACGKCHDSTVEDLYSGTDLSVAAARDYARDIHRTKPYVLFGYKTSGLTVYVDAAASYCLSGSCSYSWDWGDGSAKGSGVFASHTYGSGATRTLSLSVRDTVEYSSGSKSVSVTVQAPDLPPTVAGTCTFDANTWTATVTDASSDDKNGGLPKQVTVLFGDASMLANDTTAPFGPFTHAYTKAGTFTITHKAIDSIGQSATDASCTASPAYFSISGTVKNKLGTAALAYAIVAVKKAGVTVKTAYTSKTGAFTAAALKPGTYTLAVTKSGYTFANPAATIVIGPSSAGTIINATAP